MPKDSEPVKRWGSVTGYVQCFIPESAIEKFRLNAKGGLQRLIKRLDRHVGTTQTALTEMGGRARLPDFAPVRLEGDAPKAGQLVRVELIGHDESDLIGRRL